MKRDSDTKRDGRMKRERGGASEDKEKGESAMSAT
jgi:hypothetical protein